MGGRSRVHSHRGVRTGISWWNYEEQSYGEIRQWRGTVPKRWGYWRRKCRDRFQVPDWFVLFDHPFGGGML